MPSVSRRVAGVRPCGASCQVSSCLPRGLARLGGGGGGGGGVVGDLLPAVANGPSNIVLPAGRQARVTAGVGGSPVLAPGPARGCLTMGEGPVVL